MRIAHVLALGTMALAFQVTSALGAELDPGLTPGRLLAQGSTSNNPYNSPIRRANPNSRQGSVSATPPLRTPNTIPAPRPATIENGAIGNGYPPPDKRPETPKAPAD